MAGSAGVVAVVAQDRLMDVEFEAPALRWEPCAEAHDGHASGLCEGCGWPVDEHAVDEPGAIVIAVPERPRLRRAS
jgi:hypothetical protein